MLYNGVETPSLTAPMTATQRPQSPCVAACVHKEAFFTFYREKLNAQKHCIVPLSPHCLTTQWPNTPHPTLFVEFACVLCVLTASAWQQVSRLGETAAALCGFALLFMHSPLWRFIKNPVSLWLWSWSLTIFIFITVMKMHETCVCSYSLQWWELLVFLWSHLSPSPSSARWPRARPGCPAATKCRWGEKWCRSPGSSSSQAAPKIKSSLPTSYTARQVDCSICCVCVGLCVCFECTVWTTGVTSPALLGHRFSNRLVFHLFVCRKWLQSYCKIVWVFVFRKSRLKTTGKLSFLQL